MVQMSVSEQRRALRVLETVQNTIKSGRILFPKGTVARGVFDALFANTENEVDNLLSRCKILRSGRVFGTSKQQRRAVAID